MSGMSGMMHPRRTSLVSPAPSPMQSCSHAGRAPSHAVMQRMRLLSVCAWLRACLSACVSVSLCVRVASLCEARRLAA